MYVSGGKSEKKIDDKSIGACWFLSASSWRLYRGMSFGPVTLHNIVPPQWKLELWDTGEQTVDLEQCVYMSVCEQWRDSVSFLKVKVACYSAYPKPDLQCLIVYCLPTLTQAIKTQSKSTKWSSEERHINQRWIDPAGDQCSVQTNSTKCSWTCSLWTESHENTHTHNAQPQNSTSKYSLLSLFGLSSPKWIDLGSIERIFMIKREGNRKTEINSAFCLQSYGM